jgi:glycosyltransferase involved in cell wall biosynthesis
MKIAYLLADTDLAGGIRVIVAHADALIDRGHDVTLITPGTPLTWRRSRAKWRYVRSFQEVDGAEFDFVVGTFWTTVAAAYAIAGPRTVHFCQGYEGSFSAYEAVKTEIDAVYRLPIPKICVSPYLVEVCRALHDDATYVGQIVDDEFFQAGPLWDRLQPVPRVLLVGPAQANFVKGIDIGYAAVRHARACGATLDLIRATQWVAADGEPVELASEFHVAIPTSDMARLFATSDIYLGTNRRQEGFGLPAAEAMASGVPAILTEIPSYLWWDTTHDYALFTPEEDGEAMGDAVVRLLGDAALCERLARRGREVAEQFRSERMGERLERFFQSR